MKTRVLISHIDMKRSIIIIMLQHSNAVLNTRDTMPIKNYCTSTVLYILKPLNSCVIYAFKLPL